MAWEGCRGLMRPDLGNSKGRCIADLGRFVESDLVRNLV